MTQKRPNRVLLGQLLESGEREAISPPMTLSWTPGCLGLLGPLSQLLYQPARRGRCWGCAWGSAVALVWKGSGRKKCETSGKRVDFGSIRQTCVSHSVLVCFGAHFSGPWLPPMSNEGDAIHLS